MRVTVSDNSRTQSETRYHTYHCLVGLLSLQVAKNQAASYGCTATVDWKEDVHPYYPATVNDKGIHEFATNVAAR